MSQQIEVIKTGTYTASNGQEATFTEKDLALCAENYNPDTFDAPLVVGHPEANNPAYGWVERLSFSDGVLRATPRQVDPAFAEIVKAGRYRKVSGSFFTPKARNNPKPGTFYLRHIGFLGAAAPAVKGLKPVSFSADADGVLSFNDEYAELAARERRLAEKEAKIRLEEIKYFTNKLVKEAKVLPFEREKFIAFCTKIKDDDVIEFSNCNGEKKTEPAFEWFKSFMLKQEPRVPLGEFDMGEDPEINNFSAPKGFEVDQSGEALRQKAMAYQRAYKVPFDEAVRVVSAQGQR